MNTEGNFNSSKPVQLERRESGREQGASSLMPIGDFQATLWKVHWLEWTSMGKTQAVGRTHIPMLLLVLTSSMESLLQAKPNQTLGLEGSCPRQGHQTMMHMPEAQSLL